MSLGTWHEDLYGFRAAVTVDGSGLGANDDFRLHLPPQLDVLWGNLEDQVNGFDLLLVDPVAGVVLTYQILSFNYAARTATLEAQGSAPAGAVRQVILYWGRASAPDRTTAFTASGATVDAWLEASGPAPQQAVFTAGAHANEAVPKRVLVKHPAEVLTFWMDWRPRLRPSRAPHNGTREWETIDEIAYTVEEAGTPDAAMVDPTELRIEDGQTLHLLQGGTDGQNLTIRCIVTTTQGAELEERVLLRVRAPQEP